MVPPYLAEVMRRRSGSAFTCLSFFTLHFIGEEATPEAKYFPSTSLCSLAHHTFSYRYRDYGNKSDMIVVIVVAAAVICFHNLIIVTIKAIIIIISVITIS